MTIAVVLLIVVLAVIIGLSTLRAKKVFLITLLSITLVATIGLCIKRPNLHKQFEISVIDYLIKFNDDGSVSTTKQTTTTKIQEATK